MDLTTPRRSVFTSHILVNGPKAKGQGTKAPKRDEASVAAVFVASSAVVGLGLCSEGCLLRRSEGVVQVGDKAFTSVARS